MKILYFSKDYTTHDHRFLTVLAKSEYEVFYLRLEQENTPFEDRPLPSEVQIIHWEDEVRTPRALKKILKFLKPDVVHAGPLQECAFLVAKTGFSPLVSMSWGSDILVTADENEEMRQKTLLTLKKSSILIGDCEAVRQKAISLNFPDDAIVIFPWGIDLVRFSPVKRHDLRMRWAWDDAFVIYHSRSWEPIYGVDALAKGFVMAANQRPELRLLMLGGGSMVHHIRGIFQQGGVLEKVHFTGRVSQDKLPEYYQNADLYVSASHSDGSSVSLMEALGCGLPVLVSDIFGNREWVRDDLGWLFEVDNPRAIADGMIRAYDLREDLASYGKIARQVAEERADWQKNSTLLLETYARIASL